MSSYKIQMYVKCTEEKAESLQKELAQTIYDEFELDSVFSVNVDSTIPPETVFEKVMALCMVEIGEGFHERQLNHPRLKARGSKGLKPFHPRLKVE